MRLWKAKAKLKGGEFYDLISHERRNDPASKRLRKHYLRQSKKRPRMAQHTPMTRAQKRLWLRSRAKENR